MISEEKNKEEKKRSEDFLSAGSRTLSIRKKRTSIWKGEGEVGLQPQRKASHHGFLFKVQFSRLLCKRREGEGKKGEGGGG